MYTGGKKPKYTAYMPDLTISFQTDSAFYDIFSKFAFKLTGK
jgi:hypothetical protein